MEDPRGVAPLPSKPLPVHPDELVAMYDMVLILDMGDGRSIPHASNWVEFSVNPATTSFLNDTTNT